MDHVHKYARMEYERRFLLDRFPEESNVLRVRRIEDRYIQQTRLRLRRQTENQQQAVYKLTQKIPQPGSHAQQGLITNTYLNEAEHALFAKLPALELNKTRLSIPPFAVDVFEGSLSGLILSEVEFDSPEAVDRFVAPTFFGHEVSSDIRFTGARLAATSRVELQSWLSNYGIKLRNALDIESSPQHG